MSVYQCKFCNFYSTNHSDYNKHITTTKHLSRVNNSLPLPQNVLEHPTKNKEPKLFLCNRCNKAYKSKNGLMHHTKKCICGAIMDISNEIIPIDISVLEQHTSDASTSHCTMDENHPKKLGRIPYAEEYDYDISTTLSESESYSEEQHRSSEEYDEAFHMGIILDLLPEAQIEMTEHILLIVSIGIISTTFILGLQFFY